MIWGKSVYNVCLTKTQILVVITGRYCVFCREGGTSYERDGNMVYPPNGAAKAEPKVVRLFLLMFYFCIRKRILDFQFAVENSPFLNIENVLS